MDPVSQHTTDHDCPDTLVASFGTGVDFLQIDFDFLCRVGLCVGAADSYEHDGIVALNAEKAFDLDLKALALLVPDLRLCAEVTPQPDGSFTADDLRTPYESIESHLGSMAIKIFHRGNARLGRNPYVSLKLNPSKLTYGRNAYTDITTLTQAIPIALSAFVRACPELAALVDVASARLMRVDNASGILCNTVADVGAMQQRVGHFQVGRLHAAGTVEKFADAEQKLLRKCVKTIYINPTSEHARGCLYAKGPEVHEELKKLIAEARRNPGNAALAARVEALSDPAYQDYCSKLLRFEARSMRRGILGQLERLGIADWDGTCFDLIRCERQLANTSINFLHSLWAHVWRPVITALWGDPTMSLANESQLEQKLTDYYEKNFTGRARSMGLKRALCHLRAIVDRGWVATKTSPPASQASWYRTIAELVDAGISRAALQSCEGTVESRLAAGVVVSIRSVLEVQAVNAPPSWFKPADLSRWLDDSDLMQVPHRHRRAVGDGLVDCLGTDDGFCGPVDTRPETDAEIRAFLDRSADHGLGSHAGTFPPEVDWCAAIDQSRRANLRVPSTTPDASQLELPFAPSRARHTTPHQLRLVQ